MMLQLVDNRRDRQSLIATPPLPECEFSAIVPVKDEAQTLWETLAALADQTELNGQPLHLQRYEIIVLANNCTDGSAAIARQFAAEHPRLVLHVAELNLPPAQAYIGYVRKLLMDEAYDRSIGLGRRRGIIASTDGDTKVATTWVAATIQEMNSGVDAVSGRILTDRSSRHKLSTQARTCFLQEVGYRSSIAQMESHLDPDPDDPLPRHFQHYGASLAVTAEMYAKAGGLPPVKTPEDEAFYQALMRVDARFRHSPLVRVTTSARAAGRSPVGLANQLSKWTQMSGDAAVKVEPAAAIVARFGARRKLRYLWHRLWAGYQVSHPELAQLANKLGVPDRWLLAEFDRSPTFGRLFERVTQHQQQHNPPCWQPIEIQTATRDLRQQIARFDRRTASTVSLAQQMT
jgi:Glycosyl transferase family 2